MPESLCFSDFMKHLVALLGESKTPMTLKDERPWHMLFYALKTRDLGRAKPSFLANLRFDWDGPYPKCQDVSEFLHALHWNAGVTAMNPHYAEMTIPPEIAEFWSHRRKDLDVDVRDMLENVVKVAQHEFLSEAA